MTTAFVVDFGREAIALTLMCAGPMLLSGLIIGLVISILQAVTQVQEFTLTFIPKILAVSVALALFLPWIASKLLTFSTQVFGNFSQWIG